MKKFVSMFLALVMCLTLAAPAWAAENESYLDAVKRSYKEDFCFYQITDEEYLETLADNDIIETFHGINVTKKLLDENLVLDINKVTKHDLAPECSAQSVGVFDTEERHTLSSSYDNVVVIKKGTVQQGLQYAGTSVYLTYAYLSNDGIADFIINDWVNELSVGEALESAVAEWIVGTVVGAPGLLYSAAFAIVVGAGNLGSIKAEKTFRTGLKDIYDAGEKAIVTMSAASRSCEKWSDRYFYTEDGSRGGFDIVSTYSTYSNK